MNPIFFNALPLLLISVVVTPVLSSKNYSDHAIIKIRHQDLHLLKADPNDDPISRTDDQPEILWIDTSDNNSSYAFVRISPSHVRKVRSTQWPPNINFLTDNLQSWLNSAESQRQSSLANNVGAGRRMSAIVPNFALDRYHPLHEINRYLTAISKVPGVGVFDIGLSHERRAIKAVQIQNNPSSPHYVWIDACTHAREWITPATALFIIDNILESKLKINFIIVPVINVDGYEYSWNSDRLWRKNRRPYTRSAFATTEMPDRCNGVDLNRNYDINFGGEGGSDNPCSFLFVGPAPFSEPEVRAVSDLLWRFKNRIKLAVSLHSFNQLWACPFAYTKTSSAHVNQHMDVLRAIQSAVLGTNGVLYQIGPLSTSLYVGSGFMMDWIYSKLGITNSYLCELRDKGTHGFLLPVDQILPTALETWNGLQAAISKIF